MIGTIFPTGIAAFTFADLELDEGAALSALYPTEREAIAGAVPKRQAEFAAARACARYALVQLGREPQAILRGEKGMPVWPQGVVGTLTHCEGMRAAALAEASKVRSLGLDIEPHGPLPDRVLDTISLPEEAAWVRTALSTRPDIHWDRLLFTAKEATYKAWFPLTRRWLGFSDARVRFVAQAGQMCGEFTSDILIDPTVIDASSPLLKLRGTWKVHDGYVASAIVVYPD